MARRRKRTTRDTTTRRAKVTKLTLFVVGAPDVSGALFCCLNGWVPNGRSPLPLKGFAGDFVSERKELP